MKKILGLLAIGVLLVASCGGTQSSIESALFLLKDLKQ